MLRGRGKRALSKSSASRPSSHGGGSSNTSHDVREETPTSLSIGRGRSFVPQTRESLSSARADSTLPHTSSSYAPLQGKYNNHLYFHISVSFCSRQMLMFYIFW